MVVRRLQDSQVHTSIGKPEPGIMLGTPGVSDANTGIHIMIQLTWINSASIFMPDDLPVVTLPFSLACNKHQVLLDCINHGLV